MIRNIRKAVGASVAIAALATAAQAQAPNFAGAGPAKTVKEAGGEACTVYRPETVAAKSPVIVWGNGRGQTNDKYTPLLEGLASWGFVVAAVNTTNAQTGAEELGCLDYLAAENGRAGSPLQGKLDLNNAGAAGHSMGGGGTLNITRDPRIKATVAVMPYITYPAFKADAAATQHAPILLISGTADTVAPPATHQQPVFDGANVPVVWATLTGAGHMVPTQDGGGAMKPAIIAFFRAQLMKDRAAQGMFAGDKCGLCTDTAWSVKKKGGA